MSEQVGKDCTLCHKATSDQYLWMSRESRTRLEVCIAAASHEDIESVANKIRKDQTTYANWSVHAVGAWYIRCKQEIAERSK